MQNFYQLFFTWDRMNVFGSFLIPCVTCYYSVSRNSKFVVAQPIFTTFSLYLQSIKY